MTGLPEDWLFQTLNRLDKRMDDHGREMREGFTALRQTMEIHQKEDTAVAQRVTVIEVERASEKTQATKRGTWAGILAAAGLTAAWKAVEHLAGWK